MSLPSWGAAVVERSPSAIYMNEGLIVEQGTPDKIFIEPQNERPQAFLSRIL